MPRSTANGYRYTARGTTWEACPGCGKEVNRPRNKVCNDCQKKIDAAVALAAREAERTDVAPYAVPDQNWRFPRYDALTARTCPHDAYAKQISAAMAELFAHITQPYDDAWRAGHPYKPGDGYRDRAEVLFRTEVRDAMTYEGTTLALMEPEIAEIVRRLDTAILKTVQTAYADGLERGSNLLRSIAAGDLTVAELGEITMKAAKY